MQAVIRSPQVTSIVSFYRIRFNHTWKAGRPSPEQGKEFSAQSEKVIMAENDTKALESAKEELQAVIASAEHWRKLQATNIWQRSEIIALEQVWKLHGGELHVVKNIPLATVN